MRVSSLFCLLSLSSVILAVPLEAEHDNDDHDQHTWMMIPANVTLLDSKKVAQWIQPAWWSAGVYCSTKSILEWKCGPTCENVQKPSHIVAGGDGGKIPRYLIATLPGDMLVVAISGTNATSKASVDIDLDFKLATASNGFFPGAARKGIQLHNGFYEAFQRIQPDIKAAAKVGIEQGVKNVVVTGHSLGGALAYLVGTYLQKAFPTATVYVRAFAPPRVGNKPWAAYVDNTFGLRAQHMVNFRDAVPHVPGRAWGFWRPSYEVWQLPAKSKKSGKRYWLCGGQENQDCSDKLYTLAQEAVAMSNFIYNFGVPEHLGPYVDILLSSETCLEQ